MVGSFRLGEWLHNVQTRVWALLPDRVQALTVLDPWWNVPWSVQWQRSYYRARDHAAVDGPPDAASGFARTAVLHGEWLYLRCTHYDALHVCWRTSASQPKQPLPPGRGEPACGRVSRQDWRTPGPMPPSMATWRSPARGWCTVGLGAGLALGSLLRGRR
jgi:hypothetical protein